MEVLLRLAQAGKFAMAQTALMICVVTSRFILLLMQKLGKRVASHLTPTLLGLLEPQVTPINIPYQLY
jgi:hypothetical protein